MLEWTRELRWARWGSMVVREIPDAGPVKAITPEHGAARRKDYDLYPAKRSLLDDLIEAADSEEHRAMQRSAFGAGEQIGSERLREANAIHERDIAGAAGGWGFLRRQVCVDEQQPDTLLFEPFHLWNAELLHLRQAFDLLHTGGNLSTFTLSLYANALVDQPPVARPADKQPLDDRGFWWRPGPAAHALKSQRRAEGARGLLEEALSRQLSRGDVEIVLERGGYALRPNSLIGAAWLELGDRVHRAKPAKTCPHCNLPFVPQKHRDRVYCSEQCKDAAKNARRSVKKKRGRK